MTTTTAVTEKELRVLLKWCGSGSEVSFATFAADKDLRTALGEGGGKYFGKKSLMAACACGCLSIVKALINLGVSPHVIDDDPEKNTPLIKASAKGHFDVVVFLIEACHVNVHQTNTLGMSALMAACRQGHCGLAAYLIANGSLVDAQTTSRYNATLYAVENNRLDCLQLLIESNANMNNKNSSDLAPLSMAAKHGNADAVRLLLSNKVDINVQTYAKENSLHFAVRNNHENVAAMLINAGIEVDTVTTGWYNQYTPLMEAARRGYTSIAVLLLENGADPFKVVERNQSAITIASSEEMKDVLKNFQSQGYLLK